MGTGSRSFKPAQTQLVGGTGEDPVRVTNVDPGDTRELARRMLASFDSLGLTEAVERVLCAEPETTNGARLAACLQASQELTSEPTDTEAPRDLRQR